MTKFISIEKDAQEKKETVFTHYINSVLKVKEAKIKPKAYDNVIHIGFNSSYKDVFKAYNDGFENYFILYFGTKGDEFN